MALYIKSPKGNIDFNKLCSYVKKRVKLLFFVRGKSTKEINHGIQQEIYAACSECVIEGSLKDRISHFVVRLLCSDDLEMRRFFIESETNLFIYRLEFYELSDVRKIIRDAAKQCYEVCAHSFLTKSYKSILSSLIMIAKDLNSDFKKKFIKVPFTAALKFVENRTFPLKTGYVEVPLESLKHLLAVVFEEILVQGLNQIRASKCLQELKDPRLQYMQQEIKHLFNAKRATSFLVSKGILLEKNLDQESQNFPLCMANLHNSLRNSHRLRHTSRVQYILYLKEIGVSCQEVINLFMKEYSIPVVSKPICNSKTCDHSWVDSQNRYIYSIEHLYGNRGSRKNYAAHSCNALQNSSNSSDGGCPYACFDEKSLEKVLSSCSFQVKDIEDIKSLSSSKKFAKACHSSLIIKTKNSSAIHANKYTDTNKTVNIPKKISDPKKNPKVTITTSALDSNGEFSLDNFLYKVSKPSDFYFFKKNFTSTDVCNSN